MNRPTDNDEHLPPGANAAGEPVSGGGRVPDCEGQRSGDARDASDARGGSDAGAAGEGQGTPAAAGEPMESAAVEGRSASSAADADTLLADGGSDNADRSGQSAFGGSSCLEDMTAAEENDSNDDAKDSANSDAGLAGLASDAAASGLSGASAGADSPAAPVSVGGSAFAAASAAHASAAPAGAAEGKPAPDSGSRDGDSPPHVSGSGGGRRPPTDGDFAGEESDDEWADDDTPSGGIFPADFWSHVEDLRAVLVKSVGAFLGGMLLVMVFSVRAQKLLTWPLEYGLRLSGSEQTDILLRTDGPFSVFTFMLQLWVFGGLLLALPFVLYFASGFIAPGLTEKEKKMLRPVAFAAFGLFLVGCLFAFFLLLPTYIAVSLSLESVFGFASLWTPSNYYGAVVWTTLGMGLVFEFPLVLILLQYIGLVSADTLRKYRRHAFVFILIFAALLTPGGDPISLAVCSLPLYALFELSMVVGERIRNKLGQLDPE